MFNKSSLLAIALGVAAIASATAPAAANAAAPASAMSSQVNYEQQISQLKRIPSDRPVSHRHDRTTMVGRSLYPMPRRPMRQPFN